MKRKERVIGKERCDKKIDVKPTVPSHLYNCISDLSYVINKPIKDIVEIICVNGIESKNVIEYLSQHFKRDYDFKSTIFFGNQDLNSKRYIIRKEKNKRRISTRFTKKFYEQLFDLSSALDLTPSSATGILLEISIKDITIIDRLIKPYTCGLDNDDNRKKALRGIIRYIKKDNPFILTMGFIDIIKFLLEWLKDN